MQPFTVTKQPDGSVDIKVDPFVATILESMLSGFGKSQEENESHEAPAPYAGEQRTFETPFGDQPLRWDPWAPSHNPTNPNPGAWIPLDGQFYCPPGSTFLRGENPAEVVTVVAEPPQPPQS